MPKPARWFFRGYLQPAAAIAAMATNAAATMILHPIFFFTAGEETKRAQGDDYPTFDCPDYGEGRATDLQSEDFRQSKLSGAPGSKFHSFPN